jgi:hyperosmotically inducible protein
MAMTSKSLGILLGTLLLGFVSGGRGALAEDQPSTSTGGSASDQAQAPKSATARLIEGRLAQDPTLKNNHIQVSVQGDQATLKGVVDSPAEKQEAARLAMIGNVRYVDNQLEVKSAGVKETLSDSALTTEIQTRYVAEWGLRSKIHVATNNGVVTLTGAVPNQAARERALEIAKSTGGVQAVDDQLRVGVPPAAQ